MTDAIVIREPQGAAGQLFLLFHGVGSEARNLVPLGEHLAAEFAQAAVVSVNGPFPSDLGSGRQWFSVRGITEDNRAARVAQALPLFVRTVRDWQERFGVAPAATALVGFSQGAIMALESARLGKALAGRIVSLSGRFAQLPDAAPEHSTVHMIHGKADAVIPYGNAVAAAERLVALGGDVTADVLPFVGHEVNAQVVALLVERLRGHVPRRVWHSAQADEPAAVRPAG